MPDSNVQYGNLIARAGAAEFTGAMLAGLPPGDAWSGPALAGLIAGLGQSFADLHASAYQLSDIETVPSLTTQLLPFWEADYGLPDCCTPLAPTIQQQRQALLAKIAAIGGQSAAYFEAVALALGWTVTVNEGPVGSFQWTVTVDEEVQLIYFRAGASRAGDSLETWQGNAELECVLNQIKPAHTVLIFNYIPIEQGLENDGGVLQVVSTTGWPTSATGLAAGAVWNAGGAVYVIPGVTPNPAAPAVLFGGISAAGLLALGGGNLPLADPENAGQLWNNAGIVCVSLG